MRRKIQKPLALLLAFAMMFCMVPAAGFAADNGDSEAAVERIAGQNRWETAALTAVEKYGTNDTVIIARGDDDGNFADGLAASYLAKVKDAPILLTKPNSLPDATEKAIKDLNAQNAIVLGGELAVSEAVVNELEGLELEVERIEGGDRFGTAAAIAKAGGNADTALVVSGYAPADSLVAGPVAFNNDYPVLLVQKDRVPPATVDAIEELGIDNILVVGGETVISDAVYNALDADDRYAGYTRIDTSVVVADELFEEPETFTIVGRQDKNLADAVGAAVLGNPILYVGNDISDIEEYLNEVITADTQFVILGGTNAVNEAVENALNELAPEEEGLVVESVSAINANIISVTFEGIEEPVEIKLEEALVHGENEVTFEYEGQTFTVTVNYEDPEVVEEEKAEAIKNAIDKINAIGKPATLTLEDEAKVVAARTAVNAAKELGAVDADIVNLDHLNAAETQINALKEALNEKETAIQEANVALTNLPLEVTLEDKEQVEEARELVNKALELGAEENDFVNLWKLTDAEAKIAELEEEAAEAEAVQAVIDAIDALPEEITLEDAEAVADARAAYDALTEEQQELVTNFDVLEAAEAKIAELEEEAAKKVTVTKIVKVEKDKVTVEIKPYDKDRFGEEIEILDNNGNKVAVKPVDIAAGDIEVVFEFVTPFESGKFEGVWTVGGIEKDFDLENNLEAFKTEEDQIKFNKILVDLGIENVKVENIPTYLEKKSDLIDDLEGDLTVEAIQAWINEVNEEVEKETGEAERKAAAVEAVKKAKDNDILLLAALEEHFDRVNPEWFGDYNIELDAEKDANENYDNIQKAIDDVNQGAVAEAYDKAFKSLDAKDVEAARELANNYLSDEEEIAKDAGISIREFANDHLDVIAALIEVNEATTPNTLKRALVELDELENELVEKYEGISVDGHSTFGDEKAFDIETVKDEYLKAYIDAIKEAKNTEKNQRSDIQAIINDVNQAAEDAKEALKINFDIKQDGTNGEGYTTLGELKDGVITVTGDYLALKEYPADNDTPPATAKWIGLKIALKDGDNAISGNPDLKLTLDGDDVREFKLGKEYDSQPENEVWYYFVPQAGGNTKTLDFELYDAQGKLFKKDSITIKFVDELSDEGALVMMNEAKDAEAMRVAMSEMAALAETPIDNYINLSSAAKLEVAEIVLAAREKATDKKFAQVSDATKAITDNVTAYTGFLTNVNTADSINDMNTALNKDVFPEFQKLSASEKIAKAEAVLNALNELRAELEDQTAEFETIAEIKAAAGL